MKILELIGDHFDLRPGAFRQYLRLHRPIYQKTAAYGHFGREDHDFTWERTDKAAALRAAAGLDAAAVRARPAGALGAGPTGHHLQKARKRPLARRLLDYVISGMLMSRAGIESG